MGLLRLLMNLIWLVFGGLWLALAYAVAGIVCFLLVITIPWGIASFRIAGYVLWPFGRTVVRDPSATKLGVVGAVLWIVPGLLMAIGYVLSGALLCLTIIGIPFGIQSIKMAGLALQPFGKKMVRTSDVAHFYAGAAASS